MSFSELLFGMTTRALLTFSDMILKVDVKTGKGIKVEQQKN